MTDLAMAPPPRGRYLDTAAARRAVALVAPMIEAARSDRAIIGSGFLHLVVMDPARPFGSAPFDDAILHEASFGNRDAWDADYAAFARAKARLSWEHGMDAHRLQSLAPHLLRAEDSLLWGSVWLDGIVVAASGAFPCFDEVFAGAVAYALRGWAKRWREEE